MLAGSPLVLFWPLVFGGKVLYWGVSILQFYEWRQLMVDAYRSGQFPLWNSSLGCGAPLLANLQSAVLYPLNLIYFVFPVEQAMGYSIVLHVILAGCFTYGFTRYLGLSRAAALVSSLCYMFSGFIIGRVQFLSMVSAAAWLPLLLWLTHRTVRRVRLADAMALGLVIAVQLLAGHAQLWYYSLWLAGLYALFLNLGPTLRARHKFVFCCRRDDEVAHHATRPETRKVWRAWALLAVAVSVGTLAAAAQAWPTLELARLSQRASGLDYGFAMNYSLWPWRLITLVTPDFFGHPARGNFWGRGNYWEDCGYIGALPFILACVAIAVWFRRAKAKRSQPESTGATSHVPFLALLCIAAIVLALGDNLPIYPWIWRHVPGFGLFQAPARLLYCYTFGMAALAGIGLDLLGGSERWVRFSRYLIAIPASALAASAFGWLYVASSTEGTFLESLTRASSLFVLSGVLILVNTRWRVGWRRQAWTAVAVGFVAADLLIFGWPLNVYTEVSLYHGPTDSGTFLQQAAGSEGQMWRIFSFERFNRSAMFETFFKFKDFGPTDPVHLRALRETLLPNLAVVEGLLSANNYDPLVVRAQQDLLEQAEVAGHPDALELLGRMGVRYVVGSRPGPDARMVYSGTVSIFENPYFLPRAHISRASGEVGPQTAASTTLRRESAGRLSIVADRGWQVWKPALRDVISSSSAKILEAPPQATSLHDEWNRTTIDVELDEPGQLILADTYYPGWRVTVDGEEREILRVHHAFRAVALSAGKHRVVFVYTPKSFWLGLYVSAATWLIAVATWFLQSIAFRHYFRAFLNLNPNRTSEASADHL